MEASLVVSFSLFCVTISADFEVLSSLSSLLLAQEPTMIINTTKTINTVIIVPNIPLPYFFWQLGQILALLSISD